MPEKIGRYEALAVIGRGGMGMIYKARDPVLERSVALKVISSFEVTADLRERFFREARACARLRDHPNIVTIHDMGEDDGRLFIVMELLEGEELRRLIARPAPLTLEEKLAIVRQICDGLHHAHQKGVVHRDIKPANIFLLPSGQVKILDFGIAQFAAAATTHGDLTRTGMMMGTPRYMAPEQVRGQADQRSDIFSVGAVAYELFSGRPPFAGDNPLQILEQLRTMTPPRLSELDPSLPPELSDIVDRAIRKEPEERFADLGQMGRELEAVQRGLGEGPKQVPAVEGAKRVSQTATVVPAGAVAEPPSPGSEIDHAESTDRWPSRGAPTAWDTGETSVSRAPRIAIATGVAIAAIVIAAFYYWQTPSAPPGALADKPAAPASSADAVRKASEERGPANEISPPATADATKADREIKKTASASPASPAPAPPPASKTDRPSPPAPASKTDRPSPPARERDKAPVVAAVPSGPREDAEQARLRMTEAKRAAERVAAEFFARKRFAAAQSKERDGITALGKSDYAAAIGLFGEARSEYQAALQEVPAEEEKERQRTLVKGNLDQAHASAAARRQEALTAEADKVARDVFDQAQAKQVEADGLVNRKDLAAATRAYQEAADRYGEAVVRARAVRGR
jgi:eukaryotic-like serine/threonine-protein kinase